MCNVAAEVLLLYVQLLLLKQYILIRTDQIDPYLNSLTQAIMGWVDSLSFLFHKHDDLFIKLHISEY